MTSWLPSHVQKRLLRYALSQQDFIDTDGLDLEQLDLAWGSRSSVELRDVGLHVDKISELAGLPRTLQPTKGRITSLRLTIPANLFANGIQIHVEGVQIALRLNKEVSKTTHVSAREEAQDQHLPSSKDVANAFLAEEPEEEVHELEAAIQATPVGNLDEQGYASHYSEEAGEGTGVDIGLPGFLAGFLKGIADRLEVTIRDVAFTVAFDVPSLDIPAHLRIAEDLEASLAFHVETLDVLGLTSRWAADKEAGYPGHFKKRRIVFRRIRADLTSHQLFFTSLSRVPTHSSPNESQRLFSPDMSRLDHSDSLQSPASSPSDPMAASFMQESVHESIAPSQHRFEKSLSDLVSSHESIHQPKSLEPEISPPLDDADRYADVSDDEGEEPPSMAASQAQAKRKDHLSNNLRDSDNFSLQTDVSGAPRGSNLLDSRHSDALLSAFPSLLDEQLAQSESSFGLGMFASTSAASSSAEVQQAPSIESDSDSTQSGPDDLAESKFFTHEEAQSMYQSAMSSLARSSGNTPLHMASVQQHFESGNNDESRASHDAPSTPTRMTTNALEDSVCETPKQRSPAHRPVQDANDTVEDYDRANDTSQASQAQVPIPQTPAAATPLETKTLFSLDEVTIMVPWAGSVEGDTSSAHHDEIASESDWETRSEDQEFSMPGAFHERPRSVQMKSASRPDTSSKEGEDMAKSTAGTKQERESIKSNVEIEIGSLHGQIDLSAGRLLYVLFQQVISSASSDEQLNSASKFHKAASKAPETPVALSVTLKEMRICIQERLTQLPSFDSPVTPPEALLVLNVAGLALRIKTSGFFISILADVNRFTLGIPDENVLSFGIPMSISSSHLAPERRVSDISFQYVRSKRLGQEIHVATAPLLVSVKMQKIDERLECYGGLSGVLDLSSSMTSQSTILPRPSKRRSTLHSEISPGLPSTTKNPSMPTLKVKISLDGMAIDIKGRACGVSLKSKPLHVQIQDTGATVSIPEMKLRGPITGPASRGYPLTITVMETSVEFLSKPEEEDLAALISLIMPSRDRYEDDDDILINTLIRQRKQGSVIRATLGSINGELRDLDALSKLQELGDELSKLSNVAKYLPDDDRPGIMALLAAKSVTLGVKINHQVGKVMSDCQNVRLAYIGIPPLLAFEVGGFQLARNDEMLIGAVLALPDELPVLMGKIIGDEMDPTIKLKLFNLGIEYRVSTLISLVGVSEDSTSHALVTGMASSFATIRGEVPPAGLSRQSSTASNLTSKSSFKPLNMTIQLRDCAIGLNPSNDTSRAVILFSNAQIVATASARAPLKANFEIRRASLLAIDDVALLDADVEPALRSGSVNLSNPAVSDLSRQGYRSLGTMSSICIEVRTQEASASAKPLIATVRGELIVLETCADSTQTLIQLMDGLKPPSPPSTDQAYYTDPLLAQDLINSFSGAAFEQGESDEHHYVPNLENEDELIEGLSDEFEMIGSFYDPREEEEEELDMSTSSFASRPIVSAKPRHTGPPFSTKHNLKFRRTSGGALGSRKIEHLDQVYGVGAIHGWNSASNRYGIIPGITTDDCPFRLELTINTLMWNIFDGYDWTKTREKISEAVENVQAKAVRRRTERHRQVADFDDEESEIGDFLFQSIWIAIPPNKDEKDLRRRINRQVDDLASETGTMTSMTSQSTTRPSLRRHRSRSLKLDRSKRQKVSFELRNLHADILVLPPDAVETQSSVNVHVGDFEIYDHMPSSTWKKFVTYMHDAGPRPAGKAVIHLELQNVKPKLDLSATEMVIRATVLPLRLHVDQDTLDFITRFFEFKDTSRAVSTKPAEPPFIQRCEVRAVPIKLDYKPKKVDYAGLRSGHTKEFMNFIILDGADILLKRLIIFGISGFDQMHRILNDLWVADVTRNQLPTVLQGLAPLRPLVNVGSGIRNLIVVPMAEYQKDGRLVRSIRKGTLAFIKTTTSEIARLGARVAMGTTNLLQGAETLLSPTASSSPHDIDSEDDRLSSSPSRRAEARAVSSYANQPLTIAAGLRSAVRNLERDLMYARDAIIAVGADIRESESAGEAAKALVRGTPAVILKPAIGTTRAIGTALLGAGNALDSQSRRRLEDKYK